jgi:hypothetical protein
VSIRDRQHGPTLDPAVLVREPERYERGQEDGAKLLLDRAGYDEDRLLASYREAVAIAAEIIAEDPVSGAAFVSAAATGIKFLTANRAVEHSSEGQYDDNFAAAREAWLVHRKALDTWYATEGKPPMDERPVSIWDDFYVREEDESVSTPTIRDEDYVREEDESVSTPTIRDEDYVREEDESVSTPTLTTPPGSTRSLPDYPPFPRRDPVVRKQMRTKEKLLATYDTFLAGMAVTLGTVAVTSEHELGAVMSQAATILLAFLAGLAFAALLRR